MFVLRDMKNRHLGYVNQDGDILDVQKRKVGSVESGNVSDIKGSGVGRVTEDGTIYNGRGKVVGSVDMEGGIYDLKKRRIGSVDDPRLGAFYVGAAALLLMFG